MSFIRPLLSLMFTVLATHLLLGQNFDVPANYAFTSKEDYATYEPQVIQAINWLESTPLNQQTGKRKQVNAFLFKYLEGSPTVSIALTPYVMELSKKNPDLLMAFLGGWAKYKLQNPEESDTLTLNTEGVKAVLKVYQLGGASKDKNVEKLLKLTSDQQLKDWVKSKLT
jgi:hypothetical protein